MSNSVRSGFDTTTFLMITFLGFEIYAILILSKMAGYKGI